jgi:hypothetical protein
MYFSEQAKANKELGDGTAVHVSPVYSIDGLQELIDKLEIKNQEIQQIEKEQLFSCCCFCCKVDTTTYTCFTVNSKKLTKEILVAQKKDLIKQMEELRKKSELGKDGKNDYSGVVMVMFNNQKFPYEYVRQQDGYARHALKRIFCNSIFCKKKNTYDWWFERAPEPTDINWHN